MTLDDLIAQFRTDADDTRKPYLFSDDDATIWLNEGEEEAALCMRLLFEATDPAICAIPVTAGERVYELHELVFTVTRAQFTPTGETEPCELELVSRQRADQRRTRRTLSDKPRALIVDDTRVELDCLPEADGLLELEVYRAPLSKMKQGKDSPEIARAHHRFLPLWAAHRAYGRPDSETFDQARSDRAELAFRKQFGIRPDADQRRGLHDDTPAHNVAY